MTVTMESAIRPGKARNEDLAFFVDDLACVLDGASLPYAPPCGHDSAWYVRVLAKHVITVYGEEPHHCLTELLREGIRRSAAEHRGQCTRPAEPLSGAATVVLVRRRGDRLDYLVLCDSALIVDGGASGPLVVTDERIAGLPLRSGAAIREVLAQGRGFADDYWALCGQQARELLGYRNVDGGYWVAADVPDAADQALTGTVPVGTVALVTDGVTRAVTSLGVYGGWGDLMRGLTEQGPATVIDAVRKAERADPGGRLRPRGTAHDDATALLWRP